MQSANIFRRFILFEDTSSTFNRWRSINIQVYYEFIYNVKNKYSLQIVIFKYFDTESFIKSNNYAVYAFCFFSLNPLIPLA
jgi:hypothetical protein